MADWTGLSDNEHRTTGGRAWCFNDAEWCSVNSLCQCCDVTRVPDRWKGMYAGEVLEELRAEVERMRHGRGCDSYAVLRPGTCDCMIPAFLELLKGV